METISEYEQQTKDIAKALCQNLFKSGKKIFLSLKGEVGAGKSTFCRGFIETWYACSSQKVSSQIISPSFSIARSYDDCKRPLVHLDFYRIKSEEDFNELGIEHYLSEYDCMIVEWLELIPNHGRWVPKAYTEVSIDFGSSSNQRRISIVDREKSS